MRKKLINVSLLFGAIATALVTFSQDFKITNKARETFQVVFVTGKNVQTPGPITPRGIKGLTEIPNKLYLLPNKTKKATWTEFTFSQPQEKNVHISIVGVKGGNTHIAPQKGAKNNLVAKHIKRKTNTPPPSLSDKKEEERKRKEQEEPKRKQEEERKRKQEEERKRKQEEERKRKQEEERKRKQEEESKRKQEEERKRKEEEPTPPPPPPLPPRDTPTPPPPPPMPESLLKDMKEGKKSLEKIKEEAKKLNSENVPASSESRDSLLEQIRKGKELKKVKKEKKELISPKELSDLENKYKKIAEKSLDDLNKEWDQLNTELIKIKLSTFAKEQSHKELSQEEIKKIATLEAALQIIDKIADTYMPKTEDDEWED